MKWFLVFLVTNVLSGGLGFLYARLTLTWPRSVAWAGLAMLASGILVVCWMYRV